MLRTRNLLAVVLVATWAFGACSGETSDEPAGVAPTPPIEIPVHECSYDDECEGTIANLTACQNAVCEAGDDNVRTCVALNRSTWATCEHPEEGECDDGFCDESGECVLRSADDGKPCSKDETTACTVGECQAGICTNVPTVSCDDDNPCTDDSCDPDTGACVHASNTVACDDFNECTGGDVCGDGTCLGEEDICQCETVADCEAYDDGDKCNGTMTCVDKVCVPTEDSAVTCDLLEDDNSGCLVNACNPDTGLCEETPTEDYIACDDADVCTGCNPDEPDCTKHDYCTDGACVGGNGTPCEGCVEDAECAVFDDGDLCNGTWTCADGTCAAAADSAVTCPAETNCATFACEPATGECLKTYISCSETYEPVCGADGLSYANTCQAECNGQTDVAAEGLCSSGTLTCSELLTTCSAECIDANFADWACLSTCGEQGTEEAVELIITASICALTAGCLESSADNDAFIACATAACPDEVGACQADAPCVPTCADDNACGDDGCDGSCGDCADGETCDAGVCEAASTICNTYCDLAEITCTGTNALDFGSDDCLTACATWTEGTQELDGDNAITGPSDGDTVACRIYHLTAAGAPDLGGPDVHCEHAGPDGGGVCVCVPTTDCGAVTCGDIDDGCGGTLACGTCADNEACTEGACVCVPETDCGAVTCGDIDDGCSGTLNCGSCTDEETCNAGVCEALPTTYTAHAQPIYADKCVGCHTGGGSGSHDIGTSYADGQLDSYFCSGLTKAECTLVRINDGSMPDGVGCGGPVADDAANAGSCVTVSEVAILQAWIDGGMLE